MRYAKSRSLLFTLTVLLAVPAVAIMPVGLSPAPPGGPFLTSCTAVDDLGLGYPWTHGSGTALGVGQSFRLERAATLDRVTFRLRQENRLAGEGVTLSLLRWTAGAWEILATQTGILPFDLPLDEAVYVTLDPVDRALDAETTYAFLLEIAGGGNVNAARGEILHVGDDLYTAGEAFQSEGSRFIPLAYDIEFFLQGRPQTAGDALLLQTDRFSITATWRDFWGGTGTGTPIPLTEMGGYFWFFTDDNVEVMVKLINACGPFDRYWIFAAGMTNVEVTLRVEDLEAGVTWEHHSPLDSPFQPVLDTNALATCP